MEFIKCNVKITFNQGCLLDVSSIYIQTLSFILQIEKRRSRRMFLYQMYTSYLCYLP